LPENALRQTDPAGKWQSAKPEIAEKIAPGSGICFTAGTLVKVAPSTRGAILKSGSYYKAIEKLEIGDLALSWNEKTGQLGYEPVQQTFIRQADKIYSIKYADGTEVETTWSHPFYVAGKGWVDAKDLKVGMKSPTASAIAKHNEQLAMAGGMKLPVRMISYASGQQNSGNKKTSVSQAVVKLEGDLPGAVEIVGIEVDEREEEVYNFTVDESHNYFVSESGMLVHNVNYAAATYFLSHPIISITANSLHSSYHDASSKIFGISSHEDSHNFTEANAFKHVMVMAEITKKYSGDDAIELGEAHEAGEQNERDREMDSHNNRLGRRIGELTYQGNPLTRDQMAKVAFYAIRTGYAQIEHSQKDRILSAVNKIDSVEPKYPTKSPRNLTAEEALKNFDKVYTEYVQETKSLQKFNNQLPPELKTWRQAPVNPTWQELKE
jgi:hypothetical protein